MNDEELFLRCRREPGRDAVLALLGGWQHRIYGVCLRILRHSQDAEDATQEALLEVVDGIASMPDAERFRRWAFRVAFNRALNVRRARTRRQDAERRVPVGHDEPVRADVADAVHDAMATLDDDLRALIVEHYFEKTTLDELGRRYGCSSVAIWKRIARGRDVLKLALVQAGLAVGVAALDACLEAAKAPPTRATLITPAVLAKVAALGTGGTVMTSKLAVVAPVVLGALLFGALGVAVGRSTRPDDSATRERIVELERQLAASRVERRAPVEAPAEPQARVVKPVESAAPPADSADLAETIYLGFLGVRDPQAMAGEDVAVVLARISDWIKALRPSMTPYFLAKYRGETDHARRDTGLHLALACGGPELLAFVKDVFVSPAFDARERDSVLRLLGVMHGPGMGMLAGRVKIDVDSELAAHAARFARTGSETERMAAAGLIAFVPGDESRLTLTQVARDDADEWVRQSAILALGMVGDRAALDFLTAIEPGRSEVLSRSLQWSIGRLQERLKSD